MNDPSQIIATVGVVQSVQGATPGPASGITYTVSVNVPSLGPKTFAGVVPNFGRLPDDLDTRACPPGAAVHVYIFPTGRMQFDIRESADYAPCP